MSNYADNVIAPDEFFFPKILRVGVVGLLICTGTVSFFFPKPNHVDPNDWTRGTLAFSVPNLEAFPHAQAAAVVMPATWDLVGPNGAPGWGVDWADGEWNSSTGIIDVSAGIVSKTGQSELLRCSYQVYVIGL
jgi:hypothetical protein